MGPPWLCRVAVRACWWALLTHHQSRLWKGVSSRSGRSLGLGVLLQEAGFQVSSCPDPRWVTVGRCLSPLTAKRLEDDLDQCAEFLRINDCRRQGEALCSFSRESRPRQRILTALLQPAHSGVTEHSCLFLMRWLVPYSRNWRNPKEEPSSSQIL